MRMDSILFSLYSRGNETQILRIYFMNYLFCLAINQEYYDHESVLMH